MSRVRTVGYDAYGRMNSDTLEAGTASVSSITYGYDADNNVTNKKTTGVAGAGDNTYAYDQLGRLTSWKVGTKTTEYGWDEASNRTKNGTKLATYDERNRLINDGTSTYTYSARGALLSKTDGTTTEAFTFDAFDRMIRSSDRDFTYDALDRPVQAGTARMRYDGFSDEVVTDGTQSFGRSASDGLLSMGYDTTKRLVMADRHGDIIAGFDPTDGALSTGLPDTRTYDPFGNSTNASGLKYRVGYQGDWTDPRSGDVNQGARWYNPGSATFNSRDTMTYEGGVASSLPNLYAYATGNPLTFNDPDGHRAVDPEGSELNRKCNEKFVGWNGDSRVWKRICYETPKPTPPPPPPPPDCEKTKTCDGGIGDGGCKKNCKPTCEKRGTCKPTCKSSKCNPEPPPPPKCDRACELRKETIETREELDDRAQNIAEPPPGNPSCSNGNPSLCPTNPGGPSIVVGDYEDHSGNNDDYAEQLYDDAVNTLGSTIGQVSSTGTYNYMMLPGINSPCGAAGAECAGAGGIRAGPIPVGPVATAGAGAGLGVALANLIKLLNPLGLLSVIGGAGGGTAQPPDDDDDIPTNKKGVKYPQIVDPRTGKPIHYPGDNLKVIPKENRVEWNSSGRQSYIREWHDRGFPRPEGGWGEYDIHHIQPRQYGGTNSFDNLVPVRRKLHQEEFNTWWDAY